jgi:L-fucose dehydrogenase
MDLGLKNKVIIVTGGAKGIGEGIVRVLSVEGAISVILGRNENDNLKLLLEIENKGGKAFALKAELNDPAACEMAVQAVVQEYGHIDGLVNNAGVNDGVSLEFGNYHRFMESLHRNLVHYYLMAHYALPIFKNIRWRHREHQFENS